MEMHHGDRFVQESYIILFLKHTEDFKSPFSQEDLIIFTLNNLNQITSDTGVFCFLIRIKKEIQEKGLTEDFFRKFHRSVRHRGVE